MVTIAIIGSGPIAKQIETHQTVPFDTYNRQTFFEIKGKKYDILYFCDLYPDNFRCFSLSECDLLLKYILDLQNIFLATTLKKIIVISSTNVYNSDAYSVDEESVEHPAHYIGRNILLMEKWIESEYKDFHIIRLPYVLGIGIENNLIYRILFHCDFESISASLDIQDQWYPVENLYNDLQWVIKNNVQKINLCSQPISNRTIILLCFPKIHSILLNTSKISIKSVDVKSIFFSKKYCIQSSQVIIQNIKNLIEHITLIIQKKASQHNLIVSNTAWKEIPDHIALIEMQRFEIKWIQLAIAKYLNLKHADRQLIIQLKNQFDLSGVSIWSIDEIFENSELNLFLNKEEFVQHFLKTIDFAIIMNAKILVYNSPKSRLLPTGVNIHTANFIFSDTMTWLCQYIKNQNSDLKIALQPNPEDLDCNYITSYKEAILIINHINLSNFKLCYNTENFKRDKDFGLDFFFEIQQYIVHTNYTLTDFDPIFDLYPDYIARLLGTQNAICLKSDFRTKKHIFYDSLINFCKIPSIR